MNNHWRLYVVIFLLAAFVPFGCATKKSVKKEVTRIDQELDEIESSVEENEVRIKEHDSRLAEHGTQIAQLSRESQEALERAQNAEKLAQGKLLYEVTLTDDAVRFRSGHSNLTDEGKQVLDTLVNNLKTENKSIYVEVQGFTDAAGSPDYNMKLGEERAETVRRYLSEAGIPLHRISTISYGETRPIAENTSKAGRSKNRRVVILVLE